MSLDKDHATKASIGSGILDSTKSYFKKSTKQQNDESKQRDERVKRSKDIMKHLRERGNKQ